MTTEPILEPFDKLPENSAVTDPSVIGLATAEHVSIIGDAEQRRSPDEARWKPLNRCALLEPTSGGIKCDQRGMGTINRRSTRFQPGPSKKQANAFALETPLTEAKRRFECFRQHGDFTMAYATLQPGMNYFESHGGYIAYNVHWGATFVLGDPVGPREHHAAMIRCFLQVHRKVCFCHISRHVGVILAELGWYVNELGADMELDLPFYNFEGPKKTKLRQAARKMEREGYRIHERPDRDVNPQMLHDLCAAWLTTKSVRREARFLVRPFHFGPEPGVRKFYLSNAASEVVAFIAFDPICTGGKVTGYSPSIKRRSPTAPVGAEEAITKHAIEQFRSEGLQTLRLGLLPLFEVEQSEFKDAWALRKVFQWLYQHGDRWIYGFRGHADFKRRYRGELSKVYLATQRSWGNTHYLLALLRLCNMY